MRFFTRLIGFAAVAMVLSSAVFHVVDSWFGDNASVVGAFRQIVLEARREESLRERFEIFTRAREIKRDTTAQLISGGLSFRQAIIQFQRANELIENRALDLNPAYRRPTDPEGAGRQVFNWARTMVSTLPSEKAQHLLAGFECEYQKMFGAEKPGHAAGM
jgi:hypothetical protein